LDVLTVVAVTVVALVLLPLLAVVTAHVLIYPKVSLADILQIPELVLVVQLLIYAVVFALIYYLLRTRTGRFWEPLRWNWPRSSWAGFLLCGALLYFVLMGLGQLLPIPKHLPIDRFFQTAREATLMSILSVTLAPFMEELFFRGLLYPVLARRFGAGVGIFLTGAAFGLLHGAQLKYSWAVLIIFLVGMALTAVRAVTKSVAASFLVHVGYNGTLATLLFVATSGFRHLERLNQ
jgi:membrane protease YdiL (CAAX protease family)